MAQETQRWDSNVFNVYKLNTDWYDVPGVYIFTCKAQDKQGRIVWRALYVGQTSSFKNRLTDSHEKWHRARQLGLSHIHALVMNDETQRVRLEESLIQAYRPSLNDLHA